MKEISNNHEPANSIKHNVSSSIFKPLCVGELNELKDKIYKEQFFDYDETVEAEKVLDALQNLKNNPKLLDYVIKCLANQKIATIPNKFYSIVVNKEDRKLYDENFWKRINKENPFEEYKKACIDGDLGLNKQDILYPKVFNGISEIEDFCLNTDEVKKEIPYWSTHKDNENILNQKYSIHELGA